MTVPGNALPPVIGPEDAAALLGLHPNTVYSHLRAGVLPGRKVGARWLIPTAGLLAWLEGVSQ